jgi:nucleotide-binding universal stress UspA family protein
VTTILIGVDATARSEDAVAFARRLALATTAEIVVASIVPGDAEPGSPVREDADLTVRRMSGLLHGVDAERIRTGVIADRSPAQGLHDLAAAEHVALVVVGSTHTGHLGRVRPGSTGERLLAGAPCPVAVLPYGYRTRDEQRIARIGVAYDGSSESRVAPAAVIAAARALGASLQVATAIPADVYGALALMAGPSYIVVRQDVEADIRTDLEVTVAGIPDDVPAEGVVLERRPWRKLVEKSAELDLLLVGSRGYGPLHALILGGTSGPLMREAQCPVIALPRGRRHGAHGPVQHARGHDGVNLDLAWPQFAITTTVAENVRLALPDATDVRIAAALARRRPGRRAR